MSDLDARRAPRRALVVAYFFPPLGGGGVQRVLKFVKYLPEFGFQPSVVTTQSRGYAVKDASLADDIPRGTEVVRAPELPLHKVRLLAGGAFERLKRPELAGFFPWPDEYAGWIAGALFKTVRQIRKERPDVIFSSYAPASGHLVALLASRLTGVPWVADFRDEWTENAESQQGPRILQALNRWLERAVLRHAAAVTVVADYFRFAGPVDGPRVLIPNGVDPDDIPPASERVRGERFKLVFAGALYGGRDCSPLLRALRHLTSVGRLDSRKIEFRVVGNVWIPGGLDLNDIPASETGYLDHRTAVREMQDADALVVCLPEGSQSATGKLWEYLACERPLLVVAPESSVASEVVRELQAGVCASPSDDDAVEAALLDLYERWETGAPAPVATREEVFRRVSRRMLAGELANVFEEVSA
jgi:glycosyltransferase involved in cell wall biosynthesis